MNEDNRPARGGSNRPERSHRPRRGGGGGYGGGGGGRGGGGGYGGRGGGRGGPRGGRGGKPAPPPMLLGEPSPSLAKINMMTIVKLEEKISQLDVELERVTAKLERMKRNDPPPEEKIKSVAELIKRLIVLKELANKRLGEKLERKKLWEEKQRLQDQHRRPSE